MRRVFVVFSLISFSLLSFPAIPQEDFPIVSANGFSCSQTEGMVSCRGKFPSSSTPALEVTGYNVVWIRGEYSDHRYTYYSDSGCLCRADFKADGSVKNQECTSRFGQVKSFKGGKSTLNWCKKS